uniref:S-locus pollen protein 11-4 n=1 Tax=Raphanus sativus TaxID=3726 RepID=Q6TGF2_RAPSA|nr:S-locus pollen protein 11-4 [Raphanus sativus]
MRSATSIYFFLTKIHCLCFIFLILTYVQALDVGAWNCPEGVTISNPILGRCFNSRSRQCGENCRCCDYSKHNRRITCYCCKVQS